MTRKPNPPINIVDEKTAAEVESGKRKVQMLYRDVLAEKLGIVPYERLTMKLVQNGNALVISTLIDGGDLTADQEKILKQFLQEAGMQVLGSLPEKPPTS